MKSPGTKSQLVAPLGVETGFTLIELLAVMAIIVLLASLILATATHANYKGSLSRATSEIHALSTAIESYKVDNGAYPRAVDATGTQGVTDKINPQDQSYFDPAVGNAYKDSSHYLYEALSGFQPDASMKPGTMSPTKSYFTFQPTQLEIYSSEGNDTVKTATSPYMYIVDPFGFSYGYSTAFLAQAALADSQNPGTTPAPGFGYNPTFDLWSTAGYSKAGKTLPTNTSGVAPAAFNSNLWLRNW